MIELLNVCKSFGQVDVLRGVSLLVKPGEFCSIQGPSGSGKSTLMSIIGFLDRPKIGSVVVGGQDLAACSSAEAARIRNRLHGFVFQNFQLLPRLNAWQNVALPLLYRGVPSVRRRISALEALERVGLSDRINHRPAQLSGGQSQRVAIARALVGGPSLILADEPTGSLDSETAVEIMRLFKELNASSTVTIIIVTHDNNVAKFCDRHIRVRDGLIIGDDGGA